MKTDDCPMNVSLAPDTPVVMAVRVCTDAQRSAYAVVDAVDELDRQLGAYRALQQLATVNLAGSNESLDQLQRSDLAVLLAVLNANTETHLARVREAAVSSAQSQ
jgi:hypothetical protein